MNPLQRTNFIRLTRDEIVASCVYSPVSNDVAEALASNVACDMSYYLIRWENGIEAFAAMPSNQHYLSRKQIVEAYCTEVARHLCGLENGGGK